MVTLRRYQDVIVSYETRPLATFRSLVFVSEKSSSFQITCGLLHFQYFKQT